MSKAMIVDDHPFIRQMVRVVLEKARFEVVAETDNGVEALDLARKHLPHLIVLDLSMPKLDGLEVLNRLRKLGLPIKVLVLTSKASSIYADRCLKAGANGYMEKSEDVDLFTKAINDVMSGHVYLGGITIARSSGNDQVKNDAMLIESLSDRELRTLQYLVSGMSNKKIAEVMLLSEKTVSTYKVRLLTKLDITSVVYLAEFAKRNNLIE
ncbi:response regulator [Pseudomonas reactans]